MGQTVGLILHKFAFSGKQVADLRPLSFFFNRCTHGKSRPIDVFPFSRRIKIRKNK
jgi:hypothetical protein